MSATSSNTQLDISRHPCFNDAARHRYARVHLPVAPLCNVQCHFCNRDYDCANESRPGVTSAVLSPAQAITYLDNVIVRRPEMAVVGIAGPGDPFANAAETLETLTLVRNKYRDMLLCVASNGLAVAPHVARLAELAVSHVTITCNAIDPDVIGQIYAWIRDGRKVYRGREAGELLLARQREAVRALKAARVAVKINSIIVPGVNEDEVPRVAQAMAECGADIFNCVPLYPVAGTSFEDVTPPPKAVVEGIRLRAGDYLPIMRHCTRCRADAVGLLGESGPAELTACLKQAALLPLKPAAERPYVAVASREGVLVNQHLGEVDRLQIYGLSATGFDLIESRATPPAGSGRQRWEQLAETLHDCRAVLVASLGEAPATALRAAGIRAVMMEGLIEEGLDAVYRGREIRSPLRKQHRCGSGCGGTGTGCM